MIGIWLGKLVTVLLKSMGRRGTSLPGLIALRLSPHLLRKLGRQVSSCVIVTGTNGKTTTTALIKSMLSADGSAWIVNDEGSNMVQGVATALLHHTSWFGRLAVRRVLLEVDEANVPRIVAELPVTLAVVTNIFRDQLDRYGEVDMTISKLQEGLAQADFPVVLNGDDPLVHALGSKRKDNVSYFGMTAHERTLTSHAQVRDGAFCLTCGNSLTYAFFHYGQMGQYQCNACGFSNPDLTVEATPTVRTLSVTTPSGTYHWQTPLRGLYNQYNALAAIAACVQLDVSPSAMERGLASCKPAIGRMEVFPTTPEWVLNLVKNPTGCNSVLQTICEDPSAKRVCICINDHDADGRDVSWLWDVDFELYGPLLRVTRWICGGTRSADMAVRLKYAGVDPTLITVSESLEETHQAAVEGSSDPIYFLCTYTALYPLHQVMERGMHHATDTPRASVS